MRGGRIEAVRRHAPRHARDDRGQIRVVETGDDAAVERHLVGEVDERLLQVVEPAVVFEMLAIDVRNHRHRRKQFEKRSVAFVRFHHHQLAAAESRVAAERAQPPANHRRRIEAGAFEHQRDHRGRRRLAVRPRHRDGEAKAHQLREHLRPRNHRNLPRARFAHFGIRRPHRRRRHHHVCVADVRRVVSVRDANPQRPQPVRDGRPLLVRSRDRVPEIGQQLGDPAHADAANPDEVHPPGLA